MPRFSQNLLQRKTVDSFSKGSDSKGKGLVNHLASRLHFLTTFRKSNPHFNTCQDRPWLALGPPRVCWRCEVFEMSHVSSSAWRITKEVWTCSHFTDMSREVRATGASSTPRAGGQSHLPCLSLPGCGCGAPGLPRSIRPLAICCSRGTSTAVSQDSD